MRVVLKILDGPQAGRKALLGPQQVLQVGRTSWSDFVCPQDGSLASVHFRLRTDVSTCFLHDAGSRNGTFVNGEQQMAEIVLADGDKILAGSTVFVVQIEGGAVTQATPNQRPGVVARRPVRKGPITATFTRQVCESGLVCCKGRLDEVKPVELATVLAGQCPLFLVVDFHRLDWPMPAGLQPVYVYGGLPSPVQQKMSPVLIEARACGEWPQLLEEGWGLDAVECLFATCSLEELSAALSQLSQPEQSKSRLGSATLLGLGWPKVLQAMLQTKLSEWQARWTERIQFVLLEDGLASAEQWAIYGPKSIVSMLCGIGLQPNRSDNDSQ